MKPTLQIIGLVGATSVVAGLWLHAQDATPTPPPVPQVMNYQKVGPGLTLHELSPVVYFRGILGMTPAERDRALAAKSTDYKKAVLDKVKEYEALPPDIREARLHETQLRWELLTLMKSPPGVRPPLANDLPPVDRAVLEDRLRQWDRVPSDSQKALLANASFLDFYLRWQAGSAAEQQISLDKLSPARREAWTNELARWQTVPGDQRQQLCDQFRQFFDLAPAQQQTTLTTFTDADRNDMESALRYFAGLSPTQRKDCIESFQKFATMAPEERNQFLSNAARWAVMTPKERDLWRDLVQRFPMLPPMPPGFEDSDTPPMPPMPPGMKITISADNAH